MKQSISVVTLPVADLDRAKAFYCGGLGWSPVFDNGDIAFFQFNGFIVGLWNKTSFEAEIHGPSSPGARGSALGHNVESPEEVDRLMAQAVASGAELVSAARALPWGGYSGYFADPDGHLWEVAYNPAWPISPDGYVTFGS